MKRLTDKDVVVRACSSREVLIQITKQDHYGKEKITNHQQVLFLPSTRTRHSCTSNSVTFEDKTAQQIGSYSPTKFGVAQAELAVAILNTDFIFFVMIKKLDMVEF